MLGSDWGRGAALLHERVMEAALGSLAHDVARLHRPWCESAEMPVCQGCDRDATLGSGDAVWPCRTYTLVARALLHVLDVEALLVALASAGRPFAPRP